MSDITTELRTVAILGNGRTGAAVADMLAASGRDVIVNDTGTAGNGSGPAPTSGTATGRITVADSIEGLAHVDAVFDTVTEDAAAKKAALVAVAAAVRAEVPIVAVTATLSITDLAAALPNPARVAGLHVLDVSPEATTVEVVRGLQTDDVLVERLAELVTALGKVAVVVPDRPGFLVNSLVLPYLNDVIQEFDDGLATAEDIDVALELGLGYKAGPLKMLDRIGLDTHLQTTQAVYEATADSRYAPPSLLRRMVAAGRLGDETGHGFRTTPSTKGSN